MEYNNVKFDAIIATPGCGKTYLCNKYPNKFVDADEIRMNIKYEIPKNLTRTEIENIRGNITYNKRELSKPLWEVVYDVIEKEIKKGKIIIASPHPEFYKFFLDRKIPFCLVYADKCMKDELTRRYRMRGNNEKLVTEFAKLFEEHYEDNKNDTRPNVKYAFTKDEYLEDILNKFNVN